MTIGHAERDNSMTESAINYDCLRAAGKDPETLHNHRPLVAGCGNAGANVALSAAVLGMEAGYVDPDVIEPKNVPHSPHLDASANSDGSRPFKAEMLAGAHVTHSRRPGQVAYWASRPVQAIPLGALRRFHGIIIGIDDGPSRAWAARAGAILGIPTIVAGFYPPSGHFVATANRDPGAPCYFCLRPTESVFRASCSLYAESSSEIHPALQTAAQATMNVALEALVRFWHGDYRYDAKVWRLDLDTGCADLTSFNVHPDCPGPHERLRDTVAAPFGPDATARDALELARKDGLQVPVLELPSPVVLSASCRRCGAPVPIGRPDWNLQTAPQCGGTCVKGQQSQGMHRVQRVGVRDQLADWTLSALGLGPLGLCIIRDDSSDEGRAYELPGSLDQVFAKVARSGG
jgi:hypothetical protein